MNTSLVNTGICGGHMRKQLDLLYKASGWGAALFIFAICALVIAQVSMNLIDKAAGALFGGAIGLTVPSYADFTGFFLATASFLALAHTLREGGHIRITLFIQHLPPRGRKFLELWSVGLAMALSGYFTWYTAMLVIESYTYNDLSSGMVAVPIWIPQSGMLLGLIILSIALVDEFINLISGGTPSYEGKGENLLASEDLVAEDLTRSVHGSDR